MADCLASGKDFGEGEGVGRDVPGDWGGRHDGDGDAAADGACCWSNAI